MSFKFSNPVYGERFDNVEAFNFNVIPTNQTTTFKQSGFTMHISNGPESVSQRGILYRNEASGTFRLLYHHMNDSTEKQYLYVIAENQSSETITLKPLQSGIAGPSNDYMSTGQLAAMRFLSSKPAKPITIRSGEIFILNQGLRHLNYAEAVTGMHDYEADGTLTLYVAMGTKKIPEATLTNVQREITNLLLDLPDLPRPAGRIRGVFPYNKTLIDIYVKGDKPEKITLGIEAPGFDTWVKGIDPMVGDKVRNSGNYGMVYHIRITADEKTGILLNPRGRLFRGAFMCPDGNVYRIPDTSHFTGLNQAAVLGVVKAGETVELLYTPPSGSDTPAILTLIPQSFWETGL